MSTRPLSPITAIALLLTAAWSALHAQAPGAPPPTPPAAQTGPVTLEAGKLADKPAAVEVLLKSGEEAAKVTG